MSMNRREAREWDAAIQRSAYSVDIRKHEFVRQDNPNGGHRDRVCQACGLGDTNPVHQNAKGEGL